MLRIAVLKPLRPGFGAISACRIRSAGSSSCCVGVFHVLTRAQARDYNALALQILADICLHLTQPRTRANLLLCRMHTWVFWQLVLRLRLLLTRSSSALLL